jgi:hypothetical protein
MNVKLKEIMEAVYSSVDLLDNYRFALISAAVNGQIEELK